MAAIFDSLTRQTPLNSRALYVTATGKRVVIVRVFVKKTQKTPSREIDLALSRAKEVLP